MCQFRCSAVLLTSFIIAHPSLAAQDALLPTSLQAAFVPSAVRSSLRLPRQLKPSRLPRLSSDGPPVSDDDASFTLTVDKPGEQAAPSPPIAPKGARVLDNFGTIPLKIQSAIIYLNEWVLKNENRPDAQPLIQALSRPPAASSNLDANDPMSLRDSVNIQKGKFEEGEAITEETFQFVQTLQTLGEEDPELLEAYRVLNEWLIESMGGTEATQAALERNVEKYETMLREQSSPDATRMAALSLPSDGKPFGSLTRPLSRSPRLSRGLSRLFGGRSFSLPLTRLRATREALSIGQETETTETEATTQPQAIAQTPVKKKRRWGLSEFATLASILCALDCTVLPAFMATVPILGLASPDKFAALHALSHKLALYVMVPIGAMAVGSNYAQHKRFPLALWGVLGVAAIFAAHVDVASVLVGVPASIALWIHSKHQLISVFGAANLIASNYYSHQLTHDHDEHGHCCDHKH
ncbi:unnamed protein product [Vitrella brassicaformis CCMP3155]|uniref:MerC domain-containing protein n=1 Tax=Vitrella brassicaformis (strain CCMP3155) TaxID=1169540 RepID=A0A0G4GQQ2_VITBC|nr:unnamed protein product [Vitrella brassicaformis CCMP3155]|mmetsp:Transcript_49654/g.124553  ORF Transcript_49654/g.124553 Transcript_49654/m.124553 type:complete len:468 (-) Transcript_49654:265-1668(-)|eukprot:CEM32767.1 unnamed protein product [Vitrella brassicaformis CCMP3155]